MEQLVINRYLLPNNILFVNVKDCLVLLLSHAKMIVDLAKAQSAVTHSVVKTVSLNDLSLEHAHLLDH